MVGVPTFILQVHTEPWLVPGTEGHSGGQDTASKGTGESA